MSIMYFSKEMGSTRSSGVVREGERGYIEEHKRSSSLCKV